MMVLTLLVFFFNCSTYFQMLSVKSPACWTSDGSGNLIEKLDKLVSTSAKITCKDTKTMLGPADVYEFTEDDGFHTKEKTNPCHSVDGDNNPFKNSVDTLQPSLKLKVFSCEYCKECFTRKGLWLKHRKSSELFCELKFLSTIEKS